WRKRVLLFDALAFGTILVAFLVLSNMLGWWQGLRLQPPWLDVTDGSPLLLWGGVAIALLAAWQLHRLLRRFAGRGIARQLRRDETLGDQADSVADAFERNVRSLWPFVFSNPRGWGMWARRRLDAILNDAYAAVQQLNDRYTDPSGTRIAGGAEADADEEPEFVPHPQPSAARTGVEGHVR